MSNVLLAKTAFCLGLAIGLLAFPSRAPAQTGDKHALLLVPITYTEVSPAAGFDELTKPHWLMVPQYGNNFAKAITPASATMGISFTVRPDSTVNSVSPATTSISPQMITVHGETLGDTHQIGIGIGAKAGVGGELNVSIKKLKTVTVALHAITLQKGDTYGPTPNALTAQQAQAYLNQVYGPQTNTYFTVTRKDYVLQYDLGGGSNGAPNGKLDVRSTQPFTGEQLVLEQFAKDGYANYNIYFVHDYLGDGSTASIGKSVTDLNTAYIKDYSGHTAAATVLAHELGHLLGITYHADLNLTVNPWYLPGTNPTVRLMYSAIDGPTTNPKILVKAEWDTIGQSH